MPETPRIRLAVFFMWCLFVAMLPGPAQAEEATADAQAALLLKVVAMDRRHGVAEESPFNIAVLFDSTNEQSVKQANAFSSAVTSGAGVNGRSVATHRFDVSSGLSELEAFNVEHQVHLLWMAIGTKSHLRGVIAHTREADITSAVSRVALVEQGASVGIERVEGKDRIVINLEAARAESCNFKASLLKIARLIGVPDDPETPEKPADAAQP